MPEIKPKPAPPDAPHSPRGRETENENLRVPDKPGEPPRPATEPPGSEWSVKSPETATDPGSGEPTEDPEADKSTG
jgi:hypothetical protein